MTGFRFRFEDFVLDTATRELRRGDAVVAIEPQVFDLLAYAIANRNRVIAKEDLIEAVWNGRAVSDSTLTTRINAMRKALGDSGEDQRLIRTVARKGIRFVGSVTEGHEPLSGTSVALADQTALPLPDKPSIAVLPFQNMSGDPEQDYFCDGMVEEIITALSRFPWLFVIARNSTFTYKGHAVDVKQVSRELGVRYVVEGSVRKAGSAIRITGQLIDATTGAHLWADRFDGDVSDVFALQDKVAVGVVSAIEPKIKAAEIERARRKPAGSLDAYDLYLRSLPPFYALTAPKMEEALDLLYRALAVDRHYAAACGRVAVAHVWRTTQGWSATTAEDTEEAVRMANTAIDTDTDDSEPTYLAAFALAFFRVDVDRALSLFDRCTATNPNCAHAWLYSGSTNLAVGKSAKGLAQLDLARRLNPRDPQTYLSLVSIAMDHMFAGRFEAAIDCAMQTMRENPRFSATYRVLAACHAHLGQMDKAREAVARTIELQPNSSLATLSTSRRGFAQHPRLEVYLDGLRKAGYPA